MNRKEIEFIENNLAYLEGGPPTSHERQLIRDIRFLIYELKKGDKRIKEFENYLDAISVPPPQETK